MDATVRSIKERLELCKFADSQSIDGNEDREVPIVLFSSADSLSDGRRCVVHDVDEQH